MYFTSVKNEELKNQVFAFSHIQFHSTYVSSVGFFKLENEDHTYV